MEIKGKLDTDELPIFSIAPPIKASIEKMHTNPSISWPSSKLDTSFNLGKSSEFDDPGRIISFDSEQIHKFQKLS